MSEHTYQVHVAWTNDRKGTLTSEVLNDSIEVATPPEFPKGMEGIWSPEHYFLAAINGCLMTTFLAIAENYKLNFKSFSSDAICTLGKLDGKFAVKDVVLKPKVIIASEDDSALAEKVLIKSEKACLISNSVKSNITMEMNIEVN